MRVLFVFAGTLLAAGEATACPAQDPVDPFTLFDRAATVIEARVATPEPPPGSGRKASPIELAVDRVYKLDPRIASRSRSAPASIVTRDDGTSCAPEFRSNQRAIYFLDGKNDVIAGFQGYLEVVTDDWDAALSAWRDARTAEQRLDVLVRGTEVKATASAAAERLLDEVALYPRIDTRRRKRLVAAVADDRQPSLLVLVLARIRAPELPAILDAKVWSYETAIRGILDRRTISALRDRTRLAAIIGDLRRDALDRMSALETCERLRGERLESFVHYIHTPDDTDWRALAIACRR